MVQYFFKLKVITKEKRLWNQFFKCIDILHIQSNKYIYIQLALKLWLNIGTIQLTY